MMLQKRPAAAALAAILFAGSLLNSGAQICASETDSSIPEVTLRVCNWEEYIDMGDWDEDEVIDLESGDIFGENELAEDFEDWYLETYGVKVNVEYSTFGTNEELYNMLTLGDVYDVVCPSEYEIMKLMSEDKLVPLSDDFFDESNEYNYYIKGVSPYIRNMFESNEVNGETWSRYAAGYMWGITGFVYNPDEVTEEEASTYHLLDNEKYKNRVTIKDNVRDSYFMALGAVKSDLLASDSFKNDPDYHDNLKVEMNDVSEEAISNVLDYLQGIKSNLYSFETDSGKADMITGKVVANYQWSGDAVYTMDQAEEDDYYLNFAVPEESTNIWFDGWVMLKCGVEGDAAKQQAAEAWINFNARPDNAIRNMYYIGYSSVISGGDDSRVFEYVEWNYAAEEDEEDTVEYDVSWFFGQDGDDTEYVLTVPEEQTHRQLYAQYPPDEVIDRASIMVFFGPDVNDDINQMWINVRCFNIKNVPVWAWGLTALAAAVILVLVIRSRRQVY